MTAIRGAVTVKDNTAEEIEKASVELISAICGKNGINAAVCVTISSTKDITAAYPAAAVRSSGIIDAPLFSCLEPDIDGALKMCIRMLVLTDKITKAKHVYLGGAKILRPDIED